MVDNLTPKELAQYLAHADKPVLVDFWADWCHPCKMLAPAVEELAAKLAGVVDVVKVELHNSPEVQELMQEHHIRSIPTLMLADHGHEVSRHTGVAPEPYLRQWIEQQLAMLITAGQEPLHLGATASTGQPSATLA